MSASMDPLVVPRMQTSCILHNVLPLDPEAITEAVVSNS